VEGGSFEPGSGSPVVQIHTPYEEETLGETVTITWTANDPDFDDLHNSVEYSSDDGATWTPVASSIETGQPGQRSVTISTLGLAGTNNRGRFRVTTSDGLRSASDIGERFSVVDKAPKVVIDSALNGATVLEGQTIHLTATASDLEEGPLDGDDLRWSSHLDGDLGTGATISVSNLSVGNHIITVYAFDSLGHATGSQISLNVTGDYDFDGIGDADELSSGINPLTSRDAYSDADGDGLSLLVERRNRSNPSIADSDSDGMNDGAEFVAGTNPNENEDAPPPDQLRTNWESLDLSIDLGADTPLPQFPLGVFSRQPTAWELITDVDWLEASAATGTTPGETLVRVQAYKLAPGTHTANLRFDSDTIEDSDILTITVTVTNQTAYYDVDGDGTTDDDDCQTILAAVGAAFGQPGYTRHRDVDRDGVIESSDVGTCDSVVSPSVPGDFDNDGDVDDADIDLLFGAINGGAHPSSFDLTGDTLVSAADATYLVETILETRFGDANLDGDVDRRDAAIVASNFGSLASPRWSRGDFNGRNGVSLADLAILQTNLDPSVSPSPAAQPSSQPVQLRTFRLTAQRQLPRATADATDLAIAQLESTSVSIHRRRRQA
jgi:hypothetical protein